MALSKLPQKRRAPVRNKLPTLAEVKSKVDAGGRARFRISRFNMLKKERMSSFFAGVMRFHRSEVPSTIEYQLLWASTASAESRWLNRDLMAARSESGGDSGINRTSRPVFVSMRKVTAFELTYFSHRQFQAPRISGLIQMMSLHCH